MAEGESLGAAGGVFVHSHCHEHVGGACHPGVAGGAGGATDALHVQKEEQGVAFCVFEGEVGVAGQSLLTRVFFGERVFAAQVRLRDERANCRNEFVA